MIEELANKVYDLNYPCTIVFYGGSKHYITSHNRSEWNEYFDIETVDSYEKAGEFLDRCMNTYQGNYRDTKIHVISQSVREL